MEFEGHADQLGKLCEEMESLGIESFQQLVGKKLCPFIDFFVSFAVSFTRNFLFKLSRIRCCNYGN